MDYARMVCALWKTVQDQEDRIKALEIVNQATHGQNKLLLIICLLIGTPEIITGEASHKLV